MTGDIMAVLELPHEAWKLIASLERQAGVDGIDWNLQKASGQMTLSIVWRARHTTSDRQLSQSDYSIDTGTASTKKKKKKKKSPSQLRRDKQRLEDWKKRRHVSSESVTKAQETQTELFVDVTVDSQSVVSTLSVPAHSRSDSTSSSSSSSSDISFDTSWGVTEFRRPESVGVSPGVLSMSVYHTSGDVHQTSQVHHHS